MNVDTLYQVYKDGWRVVKCNASKIPLTPGWQKSSPRWQDIPEAELASWEAIGIATGLSGLVVIDVDKKNGKDGELSLTNYCIKLHHTYQDLLDAASIVVKTPSGGYHLYFADPEGRYRSRTGVLTGVDIRAQGGMVVAPPTVIDTGAYEFIQLESDLRPIPSWFIIPDNKPAKLSSQKLLEHLPHGYQGVDDLTEALNLIRTAPKGSRNDVLNRVVYTRITRLLHDPEQVAPILEQVRQAARSTGLEDQEIERTIQSALQGFLATAEKAEDLLKGIELTIDGVAKYFRKKFGENIIYVPTLGWGSYNYETNTYTFTDDDKDVTLALMAIREEIHELGLKLPDTDDLKKLKKAATGITNTSYSRYITPIKAMQTVKLEEFDSDPYKINMKNGVLDLLTGKLIPFHQCRAKFRRNTHVVWDPNAEQSSSWAFVEYVLESAVRDYAGKTIREDLEKLQVFLGHILSAHYRASYKHQGSYNLLEIIGPPASGKSTVLELIRRALGDYVVTTEPEAFAKQRDGNSSSLRPELFEAIGARAILVNEAHQGITLDGTLLKRMSDGPVTIRTLFNKPITTWIPAKILYVGNSFAKLDVQDEAIQRRVEMIGFEYSIPEDERIPEVIDEIRTVSGVASVFFYWMYQGWKRILDEGIDVIHTEHGEMLRNKQIMESTPLADWIDAAVNYDETSNITYSMSDLSDMYHEWLKLHNRRYGGFSSTQSFSRAFNKILKVLGWKLKEKKIHGKKHVSGVVVSLDNSRLQTTGASWVK